jgi:hypothetical protein
MVAARARKLYDRQAKERQREGHERGRKAQKGFQADLPEIDPEAGQARDQAGKAVGVSGKTVDYRAGRRQQRSRGRMDWRDSGRRCRGLPRASASEARPTSLAGSSPARSGDRAAPFLAAAAPQESARRHVPYPRPRRQSSKTGTTGRVYPAYRVPRRQGIAQHGVEARGVPSTAFVGRLDPRSLVLRNPGRRQGPCAATY